MTDAEKIAHHDTLAEIRQRIGGCFGTADGIFAGHSADERRAKELRNLASDSNISLAEVQDIVSGHLHRKGFTEGHIKKQFENPTHLFGKKLV